ncbi:MAG: DUF4384 domain-containing protein [Deltaproteobacteria bacterium]|nr:DUF4384 domain-containing protein [Deltaproteobacteria bacterium]
MNRRAIELLEHPPREEGHPGVHLLRRLQAGELAGATSAEQLAGHLQGCALCRTRLAEMEEQARAFLAARPVDHFLAALSRRRPRGDALDPVAGGGGAGAAAAPWPWLRSLLAGLWPPQPRLVLGFGAMAAASAVAVLLLLLPGTVERTVPLTPGAAGGSADHPAATRLKSAVGLSFLVQTESGPRQGEPGGTYHPGDRIQLRASSPEPGFLLVLSLDSRGAVTPFYDDQGRSLALRAGVGQLLAGSVVLDEARGPERIIGCFSRQPIATATAVEAGLRALQAAGGDPRRVERLELPCAQAGFSILKE